MILTITISKPSQTDYIGGMLAKGWSYYGMIRMGETIQLKFQK